MFWIRNVIRRLIPDANLIDRRPIVCALGLTQHNRPNAGAKLERIFLLRIDVREFMSPGVLWSEISLFMKEDSISCGDAQRRSRNCLVDVESGDEARSSPAQMNHTRQIRP